MYTNNIIHRPQQFGHRQAAPRLRSAAKSVTSAADRLQNDFAGAAASVASTSASRFRCLCCLFLCASATAPAAESTEAATVMRSASGGCG